MTGDMNHAQREQQLDRWFHRALTAFALVLFLIIALSIHASMLTVPFASLVYGSPVMIAGQTAAIRVAARQPRTNAFLTPLSLQLRLVYSSNGQDFALARYPSTRAETIEAVFEVPDRKGRATLIGTLDTPEGEEIFRIPVTIRPHSHRGDITRLAPDRALKPDKMGKRPPLPTIAEGMTVVPYPESGVLPPLLPSTLFLWASRDGVGVNTSLTLVTPPTTIQTNSWGVASLEITTDIRNYQKIQFAPSPDRTPPGVSSSPDQPPQPSSAPPPPDSDSDSQADQDDLVIVSSGPSMTLDVPPSQMLLSLSAYRLEPGQELTAKLQSIRSRGRIYFDLWYGDALLATASRELSGGSCRWRIPLPEQQQGLYFLHAYRPFTYPGTTIDSRAFYVSKKWNQPELWKLVEQLRQIPGPSDPLLDWLAGDRPTAPGHDLGRENADTGARGAQQLEDEADEIAMLLLSRLSHDQVPPPLLHDSGPSKKQELDRQRQSLRSKLHIAYFLAGAVALLAIAGLLWRHHQQTRRRFQQFSEDAEDSEDHDSEDRIQVDKIVRLQGLIAVLVVFLVMALGLYAVFVLLQNLRWTM